MRYLIVFLVGYVLTLAVLEGLKNPVEAGPSIRKVAAYQCPAGTRIVIEEETEGVVVERADPPEGSMDVTKVCRVLVLKPQKDPLSKYQYGDIAIVAGTEIVISKGLIVLPD